MSIKGRPLTTVEHELLDALLAHDFEGVEALREQARQLVAIKGCSCGCGTIDLTPVGRNHPRSTASSPVPTEGTVYDDQGESVGGLLLFLAEGLVSSLEIYWFDVPLPLPTLDRVVWSTSSS